MDDPIAGTKQTDSQINLDTGQQTEGFNNKFGSRLGKKKRDNIKKKQQNLSEIEKNKNVAHDDYKSINSEDEWDPANKSMYDSEDDGAGINNPHGTNLDPKNQNVWSQKLHDITESMIFLLEVGNRPNMLHNINQVPLKPLVGP